MKRTIKQWCREHDIGWLGQGATGGTRYDWKLVLGKGRTAIFASTVIGSLPESQRIGKRDVVLFPNVNKASKGGKISEAAFLRIIAWVEECLAGNLRELEAANMPKA
jgi:hypothetical protein